MSQPDPITQTYQAIRTALLAWRGFAQFVDPTNGRASMRPANFPDMSSKTFRELQTEFTDPSHFPFWMLKQGAFILNPFGSNSLAASITQSFPLSVVFEDQRIDVLNALKYQAFVALVKSPMNFGLPFISGWNITGGNDTLASPAGLRRKKNGWISLFQINVPMNLDRKILIAQQ